MNERTVALIGNPNTGKSSLFNALCGLNTRVGNFPGVTVEKKIGTYQDSHGPVQVVDLPGTYSLSARSQDELISVDVLLGECRETPAIDGIVVVMDANHIERDLYLYSQVAELERPVLVVLNMSDRLREGRVSVDVASLAERLQVPIVMTVAHKLQGIPLVKQRLQELLQAGSSPPSPSLFPLAFQQEVARLSGWIEEHGGTPRRYAVERLLIDQGGELERRWASRGPMSELPSRLNEARARLTAAGMELPGAEIGLRHGWIEKTIAGCVTRAAEEEETWSDSVDRFLTHRWWGWIAFLLVMFLVFQVVFSGPIPAWFKEQIEGLMGMVSDVAHRLPPGTLRSLLIDGVIAGVGGVLTFIPQIAILFFLIAIMEDCGYMARVALVMDKSMSRLGLNGKAFLPLVTSFGCAVPGIMATRTIEGRRDRMVTILVAPLMSCSARLPVYTLLITAFVPATAFAGGWITLPGLVFLAMYALGGVVAIPVAWLLKRFVFPEASSPFVIELPRYSWPSWRVVGSRVWDQVTSFVTRAGTLILSVSILVWAAAYFPGDHQLEQETTVALEKMGDQAAPEEASRLKEIINRERARLLESSYLGRFGQAMEPVFHTVGWDWKIGVGVLASFPAREVIIATLGTIYALGGDVDEESPSLQEQLKAAKWPDGRPVFNLVTALSIMVFFALCAQCAATLMTIRQETQSWWWPTFTFLYMTGLAYLGAWLVFRLGQLLP